MFRSVGVQELLILLLFIPIAVLPAVGIYRIARRAGYDGGMSVLWAVGFVLPFISWLIPLLLGFIEWPRDKASVTIEPPPAPPAYGTFPQS